MLAQDGRSENLLVFITELFLEHGYLVVFIGAAGDNLGIPATGDVVMFAGGWLSNVGWTALPLVMLVGAFGTLVAYNASYWVGRLGGRALLDRVAGNRLLSRLLDTGHLDRAERYFQAHGGKTVVVGRFTPGMRGPTPHFAGASKMSYPRFAAFNGTTIVLWAVAYALVGYAFGEYWDELLSTVRSSGLIVLGVAALAFGAYLYRRRKVARRAEAAGGSQRRDG
ncbi:hypothetical protein BH24ACT18_BH24ACT18_00600 [soil metagenome]